MPLHPVHYGFGQKTWYYPTRLRRGFFKHGPGSARRASPRLSVRCLQMPLGARGDLKAKPCCYVGKWAFHAAALCKLMGGAPPLSQKLLQYVPVELVDVTEAVPRGLRG